MAIERIEVLSENLAAWGVEVLDYEYDGKGVDFQNLMIKITEKRAATVEKEIKPMSVRMTNRNKDLGYYGDALAVVSEIASKFGSDAAETDQKTSSKLNESQARGLRLIGWTKRPLYAGGEGTGTQLVGNTTSGTKSECEKYTQLLKTKIDGLNNAASKDMTRLQSLVDKRDESYSTASSLMQAIGDTRANTIKNM